MKIGRFQEILSGLDLIFLGLAEQTGLDLSFLGLTGHAENLDVLF